ncbi:Maf family protein [Endozoicomonas numazuensis]|uniref:7-methyl-GTP pyrophosphatase n=1 Tax=Endozoicomonas numazuensis TaxID=1137799 RepID=A0A081N417_9GAMM|nr:nucleoside triphosphate pyrophosphatase [Endozoicomonas numazuensis]KEQ13190.1 septum formation inhibitor Maf [Endozoicomonas numazuensis]
MKIILASSSPYRKSLLKRIDLPFECHSPDIDETPHSGESAQALTMRLSRQKAERLKQAYPEHLIIASDQSAQLSKTLLGKPGSEQKAIEQLMSCSGQSVTFYTGLCLLNTQTNNCQVDTVTYTVHFRHLSQQEIENYIRKEKPLDCAGSFKCEGLGISLFSKMEGDDPNSLIGLPLIKLTNMLIKEGINPLLTN